VTKNGLIARVVGGLVIALAIAIAGYSTGVAQALSNHKDDDTPHAGIAVNNARFEMIEKRLANLQKGVDAILLRKSP